MTESTEPNGPVDADGTHAEEQPKKAAPAKGGSGGKRSGGRPPGGRPSASRSSASRSGSGKHRGSGAKTSAKKAGEQSPSEDGAEDTGSDETGAEDTRAQDTGSVDAAASEELAQVRAALADRTADLQRLQAEYVNYKRRVDRDRELVQQNATFAALTPIIEVLDTIDRAREHGELEGGFKTVAEQLERVVAGRGLTRFGEPGEPFDPMLHEALSHVGTDPEVSVTTCRHVAKAGYKIGDRVVRAAQVLVVDPA